MALYCQGSGTSAVFNGKSVNRVVAKGCNGGNRRICVQQTALAGRVNFAASTEAESFSYPVVPRLQDVFFGRGVPSTEFVECASSTAAVQQDLHAESLSERSQRFLRQVPALPNGQRAMFYLLSASEGITAKAAAGAGSHTGVVEAYLQLALIDIISQCWQERLDEMVALQLRIKQGSRQVQETNQQLLEARMALSGCRYLRLEAVKALAKQVHMLVDDCGHSPDLNIKSLPQPHAVGINFPQLLQQGLGLDLQNPTVKSLSEEELHDLQGLSWNDYLTKSMDLDLVGEWQFSYWFGDASLVPAPHGKFSTAQLAGLLTPDVVLASLSNGVWGRSLIAGAIEVGVVLESWAEPARAMAGAGHVGSASAWMFFESRLGGQGNLQKVRQLALAVAAIAVTMVHQHHQQQ